MTIISQCGHILCPTFYQDQFNRKRSNQHQLSRNQIYAAFEANFLMWVPPHTFQQQNMTAHLQNPDFFKVLLYNTVLHRVCSMWHLTLET